MNDEKRNIFFAAGLAVLVDFAVLAHGAYDLWAATLVHVGTVFFSLAILFTRCWDEKAPGIRFPLWPLSFLMLLSFTISFKNSINPSESFLALIDWFTAVQLFYIAINIFTSLKVIRTFIILVIPLVVIELPFLVKQNALFNLNVGFQDPSGSLVNANVFAGFQLMWIHPLWNEFRLSQITQRKTKWILFFLVVVWLINLLLTRSVLGWILLVSVFPIFSELPRLKTFSDQNKKLLKGVILCLLLVAFLFISIKFYRISKTGRDFNHRPYTSRTIWWKSGLSMFKDHPWFGVGLGNFPSAYLAYKTGEGVHSMHAHSTAIKLISETGMVGFISALCFFLGWTWVTFRRKILLSIRFPFFTGIILFMLFTTISIGIEYLANLVILSIFMGICAQENPGKTFHPRRSLLVIITGVLLSILPDLVLPFRASQQVVNGQLAGQEKKSADALNFFNSASELDSRSYESQRGLARTYHEQYLKTKNKNDLNEAIGHQKMAIQKNKRSGLLWFELANYLETAGNKEEAIEAAQMAVSYHKTNEKFRAYLGNLKNKNS